MVNDFCTAFADLLLRLSEVNTLQPEGANA